MSFIVKNPLTMPEVEHSPSVPREGARGLFSGQDGWYDIDSNSSIRKIATDEDITTLDEDITALDGKVTTLDEGITALDGKVTTLDEGITALDEDIDSLSEVCQKKFATIKITGGIGNWTSESIEDGNGNIIGSRYGQEVTVNGATITSCSKVDLQISSEQMVVFYEKSLAFVAENEDGVVTIYCVGGIPKNDYIVQAVVTEVTANGTKIVGNVVGIPNPQSDWNQRDAMKADYIKNKPDCSNALKGKATGVNVLIIDDVSSVFHEMNVTLKRVNLIDMFNATTDGYNLPVEQGKTYTLSAKLKSGVNIGNKFWGIRWTEDYNGTSTTTDGVLIWPDNPLEAKSTFTVGASNKSRDYRIYIDGLSQTDFEYIQLNEGATALPYTPYIEDFDNVKVDSSGKNLINHNTKWSLVDSYKTLDIPVPCDVTISYKRDKVDKYYSIIRTNKKTNTGEWDWSSNKREHFKYLGTPTGTGTTSTAATENAITIPFVSGYKYKIFTNEDICDTEGNYDPSKNLIHLQVEVGTEATGYEEYNGAVGSAVSIFPTTILVPNTSGVEITAEYNKDLNKVIARLEQAIANL